MSSPTKTATAEPEIESQEGRPDMVPAVAPEYAPEELEEAVAVVRARKQLADAKREADAVFPPGYPKKLYNPTYKFESLAIPLRDEDGEWLKDKWGLSRTSSNYRRFANGQILAESPEDEAWLRSVCGARLFSPDTEELQTCSCGWTAYSHAAIAVCMRSH